MRESTILAGLVFAAGASLAGCGIILGLTDHELFPDEDATAGSMASSTMTFEAGGAVLDGPTDWADGMNAVLDGAGEASDASILPEDGSPPPDAEFGGYPDVAPPCPWTPCDSGTTCCYGAGGEHCESSCGFQSFPLVCAGGDQCDGGVCCANLQGIVGGRNGLTGSPPRCNGWAFQGSSCGSCAPSVPTQCGTTFSLQMCASAADCPTAQPNCCHVTENNPFTYCVGTGLSMTPSTCLPP